MVGGETEALQKIKTFAAECQAQPPKGTNDSIYGANISCKISPWLAMGCISPRFMFDELKKTASKYGPRPHVPLVDISYTSKFQILTEKKLIFQGDFCFLKAGWW